MTNPTKRRLKFAAAALALLFVGWLVIGTFGVQWHRYESVVPGWRFGALSGYVFAKPAEAEFFSLVIRARSKGAWYWNAPTHFVYDFFEIQTKRTGGRPWESNRFNVMMPSLAFTATTSTGILNATELRKLLVTDIPQMAVRPTDGECGWLIEVLNRAHAGSFPAPRHHDIDEDDLVDAGLRPPPVFDARFQHFDLGIGFPRIIWVWVAVWALLVWIGARKWLAPRVLNSRPSNESGHVS